MDASTLPKGQSVEKNGDGRPVNLPGIYTHKESGKQIITSPGDEGIVQADALMQPRWQGAWERTGDVPSRTEILAMNKAQQVKEAAEESLQKKKEAEELKAATKAAILEASAVETAAN